MKFDIPILIVDDSSAFRLIESEMLQEMGFTNILYAIDGQKALELLKQQPVSLVLCDFVMKNLNGLELLQAMKDDPELSKIPFFMISAVGESEVMDQAKYLGALRCINRPLSFEQLRKEIFEVLEYPLE